MDKFYRIPIPIDHTATTKPRRKGKAKAKARRPMLTRWAFASTTPGGWPTLRVFITRNDARRHHVKSEGQITRIQVPMPAQKGTK